MKRASRMKNISQVIRIQVPKKRKINMYKHYFIIATLFAATGSFLQASQAKALVSKNREESRVYHCSTGTYDLYNRSYVDMHGKNITESAQKNGYSFSGSTSWDVTGDDGFVRMHDKCISSDDAESLYN